MGRFCLLLCSLFCFASLGHGQIQQAWVKSLDNVGSNSPQTALVRMDAQHNTFTLYNTLGTWSLEMRGPTGNFVYGVQIFLDGNSTPGLIVDGSSNTFIVGEYQGKCQWYGVDSNGLFFIGTNYRDPQSLESRGMAINKDSAGNIYIACAENMSNNAPRSYTWLKYDSLGSFVMARTYPNLAPREAFIDTNGNTYAIGDDGTSLLYAARGTLMLGFDHFGAGFGASFHVENHEQDNGDGTFTVHAEDVGGLGITSTGNVYYGRTFQDMTIDIESGVILSADYSETLVGANYDVETIWQETTPDVSIYGSVRAIDPAYVYSLTVLGGGVSLICHDDAGNVRWTQPLPSDNVDDSGYRILADDIGGAIVYGTRNNNFYMTRFAKQGAQIWTQTYAGAQGTSLLQEIATRDGILSTIGDAKGAFDNPNLDIVQYQLLAFAVRDDYLFPKDTGVNFGPTVGVLANDQLAEGATAILESPPSHGTLTLNSDGSFTYVPNDGYEGYDYAHYHFFKDGFNSNSAIIGFGTGEFLNKHTISPTSVVGGNPTTGTVTLSQPAPAGGFIVNLQSGSSLISVPGSVVVPQGQTVGTYTANTLPTNTTVVRQVIATGGNVTLRVNLTITPPFLQSVDLDATFSHGDGPVTGTVSFGANLSVATQVTLSDDSNSTDVPASVTVPKGASSATFTVTTHPVNAITLSTVTATAGSNSVTTSITMEPVNITDFTLTPGFVISGGTTTGAIKVDWPAGPGGMVINLSSSNPALTVPASCTIPATKTQVSFTATSQSVLVNTNAIVTATNGASVLTALVTVQPNKLNSVSISPGTVPGGVFATGTVGLIAKAATGGVVVNLTANSSILTVPPTVIVPAGSMSGTFQVGTSEVTATYTRTVTATYNGLSKIASITVRPPALLNVTVTPSTVVGGQNATGRVNLDSTTAVPITVVLSSGSSIIHVPPSVKVPAHADSATFVVGTSAVSQSATRLVTATYNGVSKSASVTVVPVSLASLTISPSTVVSGNPATGTVTLTGVAPAGGAVISLSSGSSVVHVPATVTVPAGQTHASFTITTNHVSSTVTRTVLATYLGFTKSANITLTP